MADCPFCAIVDGREPASIVAEWEDSVAFHPHDPVTDGHLLVVPRAHVADFTVSPSVTATVMRDAARLARALGPCNLVASKGREATQTVLHLHVHVVPRRKGDGLEQAWTAVSRG